MNILVSSCLLGIFSRYNGECILNENVKKIMDKHTLIPVCPETLGGLQTPRLPCERFKNKVINKEGIDVTEQFFRGAQEVLKIAKLYNCSYAILKAKSPSCGSDEIYDGTFSHTVIKGDGVTAQILKENGVTVLDEDQLDLLPKV